MVGLLRVALVVLVLLVVPSMSGRAAAAGGPGWLHTDGATIRTAEGRPYVIKAAAWFGMETPSCAPHGLWKIGLDDGLDRIASFGFTTVRLPFSNECLHAGTTTGIDAAKNPELVGLSPLRLMDRVVARAQAHGLTVILDRHRPDSSSQSPLWYTTRVPESDWIADWRMLAARYADDPTVIGADLHNEPHGEACWGCGDSRRDWAAAATRAGNAVLAENPRLLVIIEGVEHQGNGFGTWWGGTRRRPGAPVRLSVPDRVVYSPHDYRPPPPAALVRRSDLSREPARAVGPLLGLPGHREHRPGAAGRVRHATADDLRPAVADLFGGLSREHRMSFAYSVVQSEQRRRGSGRRRLDHPATGQARRPAAAAARGATGSLTSPRG